MSSFKAQYYSRPERGFKLRLSRAVDNFQSIKHKYEGCYNTNIETDLSSIAEEPPDILREAIRVAGLDLSEEELSESSAFISSITNDDGMVHETMDSKDLRPIDNTIKESQEEAALEVIGPDLSTFELNNKLLGFAEMNKETGGRIYETPAINVDDNYTITTVCIEHLALKTPLENSAENIPFADEAVGLLAGLGIMSSSEINIPYKIMPIQYNERIGIARYCYLRQKNPFIFVPNLDIDQSNIIGSVYGIYKGQHIFPSAVGITGVYSVCGNCLPNNILFYKISELIKDQHNVVHEFLLVPELHGNIAVSSDAKTVCITDDRKLRYIIAHEPNKMSQVNTSLIKKKTFPTNNYVNSEMSCLFQDMQYYANNDKSKTHTTITIVRLICAAFIAVEDENKKKIKLCERIYRRGFGLSNLCRVVSRSKP